MRSANLSGYIPPATHRSAFNCPHCNVLSQHTWWHCGCTEMPREKPTPDSKAPGKLDTRGMSGQAIAQMKIHQNLAPKDVHPRITSSLLGTGHGEWMQNVLAEVYVSQCQNPSCGKNTLWVGTKIVFPAASNAAPPHPDMPQPIMDVYDEARQVVSASPRSAMALLRLCIEMLCSHLGQNGTNLDQAIGNLVKEGLPTGVQKLLDVIRVTGNDAVHVGDLMDDVWARQTDRLFGAINIIVEKMISDPREITALFDDLPESKRAHIKSRDIS